MSILKQKVSDKRLSEFFKEAYWFHTIELGNGRVTEGVYDVRPILDTHKFDASLAGKSILDVGASDGFYAFEFEKRGAESVLALDTNAYDGSVPTDVSPAKMKKYIAKYSREKEEFEKFKDIFSVLGLHGSNKLVVLADYFDSIVKFQQRSIYDLKELDRKFDFVFCGGLFGHLKHPLLAIEQLREVTSERCVITLNGALPMTQNTFNSFRMKAANVLLKIIGVQNEFSVNDRDLVLKYVGNKAGGSFFHIQPTTFREMLLASGFTRVDIVSEYEVVDGRIQVPQRGAVFHCFV
jgi:2-polyprenyl-3-methyl-5-hydroxy-6-metoxy-1,4-benzoquinol methylase